MIVGQHTHDNDLVVNVIQGKKLSNIRAEGKDENTILTPPMRLPLERALSYIEEVAPQFRTVRWVESLPDSGHGCASEPAHVRRKRRGTILSQA